MAMRKQLAVGSIWTAGVRAGVSLMGLANTVILARLLTPEDFGLVAVATVIFAIISAFTGLSLAAALIQHKDPQREHYDTAWTLEVIRGAFVGALLFIIGLFFAFFGDPRIELIMYAFSLTAIIGALRNPKIIDFQRRLSFHQELLIQLAEKLASIVAAVTIALIYQTFWAIVAGWLASQIISVVLSYVLIPYLPRVSLRHWKGLFSFSGWVALGSGVRELNWRGDKLMVNAVLGPSVLGQYEVGGRLSALPVREAVAPLVHVLFPAFAKLQEESGRLRNAYVRAQRILAMVAFPVGIGFALVAGPLVEFALGAKWATAGLVIQVLSTLFALQAISTPFAPMAMGLGRTRLLFIRDIVNLVVRFPILVVGFFMGGLVGLLAARCVTTVFIIGQDLFLARRLTGATFGQQIFSSWRAGVASLAMVAVVLGLQMLGVMSPTASDIAVLVVAGGVSYFAVTIALWWSVGKPDGPEREVIDMVHAFLPQSKTV
ncbi:MAG: lipopolysaccharide biosynthesis protein [Alphaproteobacteria bacterium]|nr:lipopolysaccharide biosynthesis protein [Alphaproteobacteria bacterium]